MEAPTIWAIALLVVALGIFLLCNNWTKKHRPNKRTGLPRPSKDSTRYMRPGSL